jgi:erythromycin esterase-like protein
VQQFEEMASAAASESLSSLARERFMAENAQWLLDQGGPGTRMMIWANNYHVSRRPGAMGNYLGRAYGASYVNLGFLFGRGRFNAIGTSDGGLQSWSAQQVLDGSLESLFLETGKPRLLLDTRRVADGGEAAAPLRGPIAMRSISAVFDPNSELSYFVTNVFPLDFDLLLYISDTNATTTLPFVF